MKQIDINSNLYDGIFGVYHASYGHMCTEISCEGIRLELKKEIIIADILNRSCDIFLRNHTEQIIVSQVADR